MGYVYAKERDGIFTDEGQRMFLKMRDTVKQLLEQAGCFQAGKAWKNVTGDSWMMLACLDRMVELGELRRVGDGSWGQHQIFEANYKE